MMKNLLNISALLCATTLITGCSNEEMMENGASAGDVTLVATTGASTKTSVDGNYNVNWTAGDAFYVFGGTVGANNNYSSKGTFTLQNGNTTSGHFKGTVRGKISELQYAVYPANKYTPSTMKVEFPTEYTYPNSNAPMFGKLSADKQTVEFDQLLCGMMRVTVNKLPQTASGSLTLTGTDIAGLAKLTIGTDGKASLSEWSNKTNTITLKFTKPSGTDPLVLDIPLPEGTYSAGLTATLAIDQASAEAFTTTTDFKVTAGKIVEMPELTIAEIDGTTISFVTEVASVSEAAAALKAGAKNVTINTVSAGEEIEIPASDDPITININTVGENFTVKGAEGATKAVVKINVPANSKGTVTAENVERLEINGGWTVANTKATTGDNVLLVKAGTGAKELIVTDIDHIEIGGAWEKVTSSTNGNTLVMQADAVVKELIVEKGNIEIESGAVVTTLTLNADVTINNALDIPEGKAMEIILGKNTLTFGGNFWTRILEGGELTLTGDESGKGKVVDKTRGISLLKDGAKFTMKNVVYDGKHDDARGILMDKYVNSAAITIQNSTVTSKYYCINTNASEEVGTGNTITLTNSKFTAVETALMVNNAAALTATSCEFTGGWQGAFLRGGTFTFDGCTFNLNVDSKYDENGTKAGATSWGDGNNAPSAAITAGNRSTGAYDYKTSVALTNNCAFTVQVNGKESDAYPAIYLDAEQNKEKQGVTFTYDTDTFGKVGTGLVINNTTGQVIVNNEEYKGVTE
ncbi:hypothetical protein [Bacteroides sp.]|uniref:hypothetical protein n=1 Tax=Bacteroides sp. TaxID=29523 RepID=UPI003AB52636